MIATGRIQMLCERMKIHLLAVHTVGETSEDNMVVLGL
jgi:hypothetical protein